MERFLEILAFEDLQEANDLCTFYGIPVGLEGVIFKSASFVIPENKIAPRRSNRIIEAKVEGVPLR